MCYLLCLYNTSVRKCVPRSTWYTLPYQVRCALRNITEICIFLCLKSKETYYARCQELDKFKKDGSSPKEIEKVSPSDIILLMIWTPYG